MPQVPRLLMPRAEAAQTLAEENEYHLMWREWENDVLLQNTSPHLAEEDTNMGDEAFVWVREDPEFFLIVTR